MTYVAKEKLIPEEDKSPPLNKDGTKRIQGIVGALLYYAISVDNKLLVGLSLIWYQQAAATERTNEEINQLIDYSATCPANGILYRSRNMVLCAHSDTGFHNNSKGRSRVGDHICISEKNLMPRWNGPVIKLTHIIKIFMSSASEAELGALFIKAQYMLAMRNTLE